MTKARSRDDLEEYLGTSDARSAAWWELEAVASMRRALGEPFSVATYATMRRLLAEATGAKNVGSDLS